jgi:hypothetical protein
MKTVVKRVIRNEKGYVLITVLILLVVGGLILTPLLGLMSTGLLAGQVYEKKMQEYYAADAGSEDAIWRIQTNNLTFGTNNWSDPWNLTLNGKNVTVQVYREDLDLTVCGTEFTYRILSIADTNDAGGTAAIDSSTIIDAHLVVSHLNLSALLDYAIISDDTIRIQPGNNVTGDVYLPDENDLDIQPESTEVEDIITGEVIDEDDVIMNWPTSGDLSNYYLDDVEGAYDPGNFVDITYTNSIGPVYRDGDLTFDNTGGNDATLNLTDTIYVTGDVMFQQSGESGTYTLNLNGKTIFAEGEIRFPSNRVTISGSGCIIAVGSVTFQPAIAEGEEEHFVLVMSVENIVDFGPSGDFTGCIAGNMHVQLQPGCTIDWISPEGEGLDFPGMDEADLDDLPITGLKIESWEINPE